MILSPSVAAVIYDDDGLLLLQEKVAGEPWSLPAGRIELGETPEEAIVREVMEETGHRPIVSRVLGVFGGRSFRRRYHNGDEVEYVVTLFAFRPENVCLPRQPAIVSWVLCGDLASARFVVGEPKGPWWVGGGAYLEDCDAPCGEL